MDGSRSESGAGDQAGTYGQDGTAAGTHVLSLHEQKLPNVLVHRGKVQCSGIEASTALLISDTIGTVGDQSGYTPVFESSPEINASESALSIRYTGSLSAT